MLLLGFCPSAQYNGPFELANWGKRDLTTARVGISPFIIIVIIIIIIIVIFIIIITIIIIVIIIITIIIIIIIVTVIADQWGLQSKINLFGEVMVN